MHSAPTAYVATPDLAFPFREEPRLSARPALFWSRQARVCWLIFAIAVLSIADLHMTLVHLTSIGMSEENPIARLVMSANSPAALIAWKLTSVGAACLAFFAGRHKRISEIAAWFCCAVLVWLTVRWGQYSTELQNVCPQMHLLHHAEGALWVRMTPE
jgi:hypothetical protein